MGWEQLAPSIQSGFDTYWGRKEGQKGRAHEKEMQGKRIAHDRLQQDLDRAQEKYIADRTLELTKEGWDRDDAREKSRQEFDERMRNLDEWALGQRAREKQTHERGMEFQKEDIEKRKVEGERAYMEEQLPGLYGREDIVREDKQAFEMERARVMAAGAGTGKEFSPGAVAEEITKRADEAIALFKMGWEDFSRVFPRLISKDTYDSLKQVGKDKEIADYLTAEMAKQYIRMYATEAEEAGYNLPKEFHYLLDIDDKYMETIQATFDEEMNKAKQKKATRKEKTATQAKEWGQWRTGPSPLDAPFRSKFPRATAGYDKFLEFFKKLP